MKAILKTTLLCTLLLFSVSVFGAPRGDSCNLNSQIIPLLNAMKDDPNGLGRAIKNNIDLARVIENLEHNGVTDEDVVYDPEILQDLVRLPRIDRGFPAWWDQDLSDAEASVIWNHQKLRDSIKRKLRYPGGYHEWCMVCKALTFKKWGVTVEQIHEFRSDILNGQLTWIVPNTETTDTENDDEYTEGEPGEHGGNGSTRFHNELAAIIDKVDAENTQGTAAFNAFKLELRQLLTDWKVPPRQWPDFL